MMSKANSAKKMTADGVLVHIVGAVYSGGDTITFEVLQQIGGQMYLSAVVQCEQVLEDTYTFGWDKIPDEVMDIYKYVNSKSTLEEGILFGPHILRPDSNTYALCKFKSPVIGATRQITEWSEITPSFFRHFARDMKKFKQLS